MKFLDYVFFFFFKQKTAYEMLRSLVGSEMCIRDRGEVDCGGQHCGTIQAGLSGHEDSDFYAPDCCARFAETRFRAHPCSAHNQPRHHQGHQCGSQNSSGPR
eukprot:TRINITY_DN2771_c0_g1_i24.p2 TRINITY_DN2771_c0_g1~~TRINITY_DN2771_c0_g1_i24.p2  ORF type:complete len:102 (-),score=20.62 TRINITY_DN2771_c0_g1_i24:686-991(-)